MEVPVVRDELAAMLEEYLGLTEQLAAGARDRDVPVADLVAQATMLERLDERRDTLISQLRRTASAGNRAARRRTSMRAHVLEVLDQLGWPQNAGFCEEYLWARRQLQLDSRAFASLRRDEQRSWQRSPASRNAYIVPALNPDGTANPRWLTSSAWPLVRRVVASPQTEELYDLQKIASLDVRGHRGPLGTLLERYAKQVLDIDPPPVSATPTQTSSWRIRVRRHARELIDGIRTDDDPRREALARDLESLPEQDRTWGRGVRLADARRPSG